MDWQPVGDQLGSFGQVILTAARYAPGSAFTYARDQVAGAMVGSMVELNVLSKQVPPVPLDVRSGSSATAHPITMKVPYEPGLADGWPNLRCRYEARVSGPVRSQPWKRSGGCTVVESEAAMEEM